MKKWIFALLLAASSAAFADEAARKQWEDKIVLLTNGMTRSQVEAIFPIAGGQRMIESSDSYTLTYNVDGETVVTLRYDYSGNQMAAHGNVAAAQNPDNRLIGTLGLSASMLIPPMPPKKIEKTRSHRIPRTLKTSFHRTRWPTSHKNPAK